LQVLAKDPAVQDDLLTLFGAATFFLLASEEEAIGARDGQFS
jgi:hypothetical protein